MTQVIRKILFSYWTTLTLFFILGAGAAVATFIENDYGTSTARVLVYNHTWYEVVMVLSIINLIGIIYKTKMWNSKARFIFHISFVVMLIGAGVTRYVGFEGIMHIKEGQTQNKMISLEPYLQITVEHEGKTYYKEYQKELSALGNDFTYTVLFEGKELVVEYENYLYSKKGGAEMGILTVNASLGDESQSAKLVGKRGMQGLGKTLKFDNAKVYLEYGSKPMTLPFAIKLRDFELKRYPGSNSPSSYASEVTLVDTDKNKEFDYRIFMNNTLKYGNYQFFQSSYDPDETGTILSVNNDPGKWPTYLGYFLLTLGLVMNMFDKKSRFLKLTRYLKQFHSIALILFATTMLSSSSHANESQKSVKSPQNSVVKYLQFHRDNSAQAADRFGYLVTQSGQGRMKPVNTLSTEILNKLSRKSTLLGMNADQVVLGMLTRPEMWRDVKMLKISTPKLKNILNIEKSRDLIAFSEVFDGRKYVLKPYVEKANKVKPQNRGTFEKDVIRVDERLNIAYMVYFGNLFNIFPHPSDGEKHNNKWYTPIEAMNGFEGEAKMAVETMTKGFINSVAAGEYEQSVKYIDLISQYQRKAGASIIPSESVVANEVMFNKLNIFPRLNLAYLVVGFVLFIVGFMSVFSDKWAHGTKRAKILHLSVFTILVVLFALHTFGMGYRWYISGHAPWSDTYESLLYIAWSAMFAGIVFFRKSLLALSGTAVMAAVFMFTAHLSGIDPQITNLVPVLQSYWLTIHVSIITGSYGFLALGAILGFMALILFIFRNPRKQNIDRTIYQITAINEIALIVGLAMLIVGNFLGGVWANESWGRYWGWDPKETWAWVSIIVYAFVIHMRFIKKLDTPFVFSAVSLVAFSSILMTYFGVNFYLSGMHSYATGDPVPIPAWVYILSALVFVVIALAYRKRDLPRLNIHKTEVSSKK